MSQENVEIVKAGIDAYNREDWDAVVKHAAPGFELDFSRAVGPWRGVFGLDQARRLMEEVVDTWDFRPVGARRSRRLLSLRDTARGDVAGERGTHASGLRSVERRRYGGAACLPRSRRGPAKPRGLARAGTAGRTRCGHAKLGAGARSV